MDAGGGPTGWPENALLYVGASPSSTISYEDPIVSRFGLILTTKTLEEDEFVLTLKELAAVQSPSANLDDESLGHAVQMSRKRGGLTIRNAHLYVKQLS
jgi:hypothetical protein